MAQGYLVELTVEQIATLKECIRFSEHKIRNFDYTYGQGSPEARQRGNEIRKQRLAELADAKQALAVRGAR